MVDLCGLYLLRHCFEKVKYWNADTVETQGLKEILPKEYWAFFKKQGFRMELLMIVKNTYEEI